GLHPGVSRYLRKVADRRSRAAANSPPSASSEYLPASWAKRTTFEFLSDVAETRLRRSSRERPKARLADNVGRVLKARADFPGESSRQRSFMGNEQREISNRLRSWSSRTSPTYVASATE